MKAPRSKQKKKNGTHTHTQLLGIIIHHAPYSPPAFRHPRNLPRGRGPRGFHDRQRGGGEEEQEDEED